MKLLGIDSSTRSGSVAVVEDSKIIGELLINTGPSHSENLVPSIDWLLNVLDIDKKELDAIAVSKGPGSFTSLRVGLTVAKSLAYTLNIKIVGISTLEILASNIPATDKKIYPIIDAKRGEVYSAEYFYDNDGNLKCGSGERIVALETLLGEITEPSILLGDGVELYADLLKNSPLTLPLIRGNTFSIPKASNCALLGYGYINKGLEDSAMSLVPNYIRESGAENIKKTNI